MKAKIVTTAKLLIMLSSNFLSDLFAVFSFFEQSADHVLTDNNIKLVVQKSDHVILINNESLIKKVKKLLSMIFIQKSRSINCIKRKHHIVEIVTILALSDSVF